MILLMLFNGMRQFSSWRHLYLAVITASLVWTIPVEAQQIPALAVLPPVLASTQPSLTLQRQALVIKRNGLREKFAAQKAKCSSVNEHDLETIAFCTSKKRELTFALIGHIQESEKYNNSVSSVIATERQRLLARDMEITAALERDVTAIRNLGFDRRAEDFAEWEKLGEDAKSKFEKDLLDSVRDQIIHNIRGNLVENFKEFDSGAAARWIADLEAKGGPLPAELVRLIERVAASPNRALRAEQADLLIEGVVRYMQTRDARTREKVLLVGLDLLCDVTPPPARESCKAFKATSQLTVASLYNNATRRVAIHEVELLTTMTEAQLKGLAKISKVLGRHVKDRNKVRAELKALG
jgi:hypothetical protein